MRKLTKQLIAMAMAGAVMVVPMTAQAADTEVTDPANATGTVQGSGDVEAIVNKDVFSVVLPTVADEASTFNFILDPQEVIKATNNAAYAGATFNDHTGVYFNNATDTYGKDSKVLTATNKSSYDVDLTLSATASDLADATKGYSLTLTDDSTFANDNATSLYLALVSGSETKPLSSAGANITTKISALANAYEIAYDTSGSQYKYQLKSSATGFKTASFNLTGACNKAADWTIAKDAAPKVDVTWTVDRHFEAPTSDGTVDVVIPYTGAKPAAGSITLKTPTTDLTPGATKYSDGSVIVTDTTITFAASWVDSVLKNNRGLGTYSFELNNKTYSFYVVDEVPPVIPSSDGTTDIVINYTGTTPADGSLTIKTPGADITPGAAKYSDGSITVTDTTITFSAVWLNDVLKTTRGTGSYSFAIDDTEYEFEIV